MRERKIDAKYEVEQERIGRKQRKKDRFDNQRKVIREKDGEKIKSLRVDEKK